MWIDFQGIDVWVPDPPDEDEPDDGIPEDVPPPAGIPGYEYEY